MQTWIEHIAPRLDLPRMRNHLTGQPMTPADLRASLEYISGATSPPTAGSSASRRWCASASAPTSAPTAASCIQERRIWLEY
jgi:hypothetical protein